VSEGRVLDVLARFASSGRQVGNNLFLPIFKTRRLIAAGTESQLLVLRINLQLEGQSLELGPDDSFASIEAPDLTGLSSWEAMVFRANANALATVDRLRTGVGGVVSCAVELVGRADYYRGRSHLPLESCVGDELAWRTETHDASSSRG
jgi:hypothetical protein